MGCPLSRRRRSAPGAGRVDHEHPVPELVGTGNGRPGWPCLAGSAGWGSGQPGGGTGRRHADVVTDEHLAAVGGHGAPVEPAGPYGSAGTVARVGGAWLAIVMQALKSGSREAWAIMLPCQ